MHISTDDECIYTISKNSDEINSEEESQFNEQIYNNNYYNEDEYEESMKNEEKEFIFFEFICIAALDNEKVIMKHSFLNKDIEYSSICIIKKILSNAKRKLTCGSRKALKWNDKIIYFIICDEKKLIFFLIGSDVNGYFKNYAYEFLRKLEEYTKSELFYNTAYNLNNINQSKVHSTISFMKGIINNLNKCCKNEKIIAVKEKLYKINSVMNSHIDTLYQSGNNIRCLQNKTEHLSRNTLTFLQNSKKLKRMMIFKYWKTYFILACCFLLGFKIYRSI